MKTARKPVNGVVSSTRIGRDLISGTEAFSPETLEAEELTDFGRGKAQGSRRRALSAAAILVSP